VTEVEEAWHQRCWCPVESRAFSKSRKDDDNVHGIESSPPVRTYSWMQNRCVGRAAGRPSLGATELNAGGDF